jgi:predicted RNase H-like nuclease
MRVNDYVVGVDGCRSGWLVCRYQPDVSEISFSVHQTFAAILEDEAQARVIAVDIPIGLTEDGRSRRCDLEARKLLAGPRASSVFPAPARCLLREGDYAAACARSRELRGKAVSRQAFAIFRKIAEVDEMMNSAVQEQVFEVHPEVCFLRIASGALEHSKKTRAGYDERRTLLSTALSCAIPSRDQVRHLGLGAQHDDLLDAAIAAVAADRVRRGTAERLPRETEFDAKGLRMEMVY